MASIPIGVTGTRHGLTRDQSDVVWSLLQFYASMGRATLHHGDAIGADADIDAMAHLLQIPVCLHPPDNPSKRAFCEGAWHVCDELPYLERNEAIVKHSAVLIGCPENENGELLRSGTWATIRFARKHKVLRIIVRPSGLAFFESDNQPSNEE